MDIYLAEKDGKDHAYYAQYNTLEQLKQVVIAYEEKQAIACGAFRQYEPGVVEIKRMFTLPAFRGRGVAALVLKELESWAAELSYHKCILETGKRQKEAVIFYPQNDYVRIPNYGPYIGVENSLCFEKRL